jgi:DNA-binding NarL/FixJ family response regulator
MMNSASYPDSTTGKPAVYPRGADLPTLAAVGRLLAQDPAIARLFDALRDLTVDQFLTAVRTLGATDAERHLHAVPPVRARDMRDMLTERELEVVRLLSEGLSNKQISDRLALSDKTVKNHMSHILAKLNLSARTQVAVMALRAGIV